MLRRQSHWRALLLVGVLLSISSHGWSHESRQKVQLQDLIIKLPDGWTIAQKAKDRDRLVIGFKQDNGGYVTVTVARDDGKDINDVFGIKDSSERAERANLPFTVISKRVSVEKERFFTQGFFLKHNGFRYVGYSTQPDGERTQKTLNQFLSFISKKEA